MVTSDPDCTRRRAPPWDSARRDEVSEHAVRRMQHRDDGAAKGILLGEVAAEESLLGATAMRGHDRHDHDVRIEGTHRLHANELETKRAIRELLDGSQCGVCSDTKIAKRARNAFRLSRDALALEPLELDLGTTRSRWRAMKDEVREAEPFTLELCLADDRTGVLARRRRRKHAGSAARVKKRSWAAKAAASATRPTRVRRNALAASSIASFRLLSIFAAHATSITSRARVSRRASRIDHHEHARGTGRLTARASRTAHRGNARRRRGRVLQVAPVGRACHHRTGFIVPRREYDEAAGDDRVLPPSG